MRKEYLMWIRREIRFVHASVTVHDKFAFRHGQVFRNLRSRKMERPRRSARCSWSIGPRNAIDQFETGNNRAPSR